MSPTAVSEAGGRARCGSADRLARGGLLLAGAQACFEEGLKLLETAGD
jgi:hypothetical protein